jgi:hypothetical protein
MLLAPGPVEPAGTGVLLLLLQALAKTTTSPANTARAGLGRRIKV